LQDLVGTHRCPTFVHAARLPPLPLTTFVRAARILSIQLTYVRTHCRTSLIRAAVLHSYMLRAAAITADYIPTRCSDASHALLGCCQHRWPAFVRVAEPHWYAPLSYIHTRCSSTVNIVHLHSHALQNLVDTHRCPTFVHAARLPPLPLTTFPRAARMLSTLLTCVRTRCRTSLVRTAVLHSYLLRVCRHYR